MLARGPCQGDTLIAASGRRPQGSGRDQGDAHESQDGGEQASKGQRD